MTKPNSIDITVILDRSGSMETIAPDMRGGFDSFVKKQRALPGDCRMTLVQFDTDYEVVYTGRPIADVPPLELQPRGSTALLDAVGRTIVTTGERLKAMSEADRPSQVLFLIITDGQENSSHEYKRARIAEMTKHQRDVYKWEFVYLGANQDAFSEAAAMGVLRNAVNYDASPIGAAAAFSSASAGIAKYRSAGHAKMDKLIVQQDYDKEAAKAAKPKHKP